MRVIGIVSGNNGAAHQRSPGPDVAGHQLEGVTDERDPFELVDGIIGNARRKPPAGRCLSDAFTRNELLGWQRETCYADAEDWVFASARAGGKMPPGRIRCSTASCNPPPRKRDRKMGGLPYLPAHLLDRAQANNEDVKVVQELMRHANITTTMNIYTKA